MIFQDVGSKTVLTITIKKKYIVFRIDLGDVSIEHRMTLDRLLSLKDFINNICSR